MGLFSGSKKEKNLSINGQPPIELVSCPLNGVKCERARSAMNESMVAARKYRVNKEYPESIIELKAAFEQTNLLQEDTCQNCIKLFRSTIIESMEIIQKDLQKMTTGFFRDKRYLPSLEMASSVLEEFKKRGE